MLDELCMSTEVSLIKQVFRIKQFRYKKQEGTQDRGTNWIILQLFLNFKSTEILLLPEEFFTKLSDVIPNCCTVIVEKSKGDLKLSGMPGLAITSAAGFWDVIRSPLPKGKEAFSEKVVEGAY